MNPESDKKTLKQKLVLMFLRSAVFRSLVGGIAGFIVAQVSKFGLWLFEKAAALPGIPLELAERLHDVLVLTPENTLWLEGTLVISFMWLAEAMATHGLITNNAQVQEQVDQFRPAGAPPIKKDGVILAEGETQRMIVAGMTNGAVPPPRDHILPRTHAGGRSSTPRPPKRRRQPRPNPRKQ